MAEDKNAPVTQPDKGGAGDSQQALPPEVLELAQAAKTRGLSVGEYLRREAQSAAQSVAAQEVKKAVEGLTEWQKGVNEAGKRFDEMVGTLQKGKALAEGVDLSALRTDFVNQALSSPPQIGGQEAQKNSDDMERLMQDPVYLDGLRIAAKYNLAGEDPEANEIVTGQGPKAYLDSIEVAGKKKAQRVGGGTLAPEPEGGKPPLMPMESAGGGTVGANPLEGINDPDVLLEMGLK